MMVESGRPFGKYHILRTIGTGGFAQVYLGEHIYLKTRVAIKVLQAGSHLPGQELERFMTEARIIAQLKHPHIINVLDFDIEKGIPYLVMGYAPNGSLHLRHPLNTILNPSLILFYVKQIASALQFAHDQHIIHCDVKPENMLLGPDNEVLLTDFGIAVILRNSIKTQQQIMGTMHYMAPEQFMGKPVPASDQYALAVLIYRWLCGSFPFSGKDPFALQRLHETAPPPSLRTINPRISRDIEYVVLTALEKDPHQRFASVSAFATALENACASRQRAPAAMERKPDVVGRTRHRKAKAAPGLVTLPPSIVSLLPQVDAELPDASPSFHLSAPPESAHQSPTIVPHIKSSASAFPAAKASPLSIMQTIGNAPSTPSSCLPAPEEAEPGRSGEKAAHLTYNQHTAWVSTVAWSPQGKLIASGSWDSTVQIWDASTGENICTYRGHRQPVKSVAWSPNGTSIASGSWDNTVQIWDAVTGVQLSNVYQQAAQIEAVAWSPDGNYIASAGHDGIVNVWHPSSRNSFTTYHNHKGPVWSISWSPDGHSIASASHDGTVQIWDALTGGHIMTYDRHHQRVAAVAWSPDGKLIASSDYDGSVFIWDSVKGQTNVYYRDENRAVKALAWSPDGMQLASAVRLVQVRTIGRTHQDPSVLHYTYAGHTSWVNSLAWSPDGLSIASSSDDKTVQVWEVK